VIVLEIQIAGIFADEAKRDAPVARYAHCLRAFSLAFKLMQMHARDIKLLYFGCTINQVQHAANARCLSGTYPAQVTMTK